MKLRIRGNSLRVRVTRSELELIRNNQPIQEMIHFGCHADDQLSYSLEASCNTEKVEVIFQNQRIRVMIPESVAQEWTVSDQVTLFAEQQVGEGQTLKILIEKDFFCLKPRNHPEHEDESDFFSHPNSASGTCG